MITSVATEILISENRWLFLHKLIALISSYTLTLFLIVSFPKNQLVGLLYENKFCYMRINFKSKTATIDTRI